VSGRLLWFVAGAGSAVWVGVKGRRAAHRLTPEGVADQLGAARLGLRALNSEFAAGAAAHEQLPAERLGLAVDPPQLRLAKLAGAPRASEATGARPRLVAAADPSSHS
jgi:hypothetical protein